MLSKLANVPTIPYEQMEFWNSTAITATFVLAILTGLAVIIICARAASKTIDIVAFHALGVGVVAFAVFVCLPYLVINTEYLKEGSAANLTELGYQNVTMVSFEDFTATKSGKYITGQLVDTPDGDEYYVIELSSAMVE